jgi:hypothetical protein
MVLSGLTPLALFQAHPSLEGLPTGQLKYTSLDFAMLNLPMLRDLILRMAEGVREPRVSYTFRVLRPSECFGHGRWHCDGKERPEEIHRLLTIGGNPTEGENGVILHAGTVWQYNGAYQHRAVPSKDGGPRLMLRLSETSMGYRNFWSH